MKFVCFGSKSYGHLNFSRQKTTTKPSLFYYILLCTVGWGKKEIARVRDKKQETNCVERKTRIFYSGGEKMRNLEATKVKKCGSEKKSRQGHTIFPLLAKSAACAKLFFANSTDFFAVLVAVAV